MIRIGSLEVAYATAEGPVHAVRGIDLTIERGQFYTLLGPSGCGKTTTLRCVAGLEFPNAGEIEIDGHTVFSRALGTGEDVWDFGFPNLDLSETDNEVEVRMDAPGFKPDEIEIRLDGNILTVRGEHPEE